jgi:ketosteroid isomerase-like protein
LQGCSVAGAGSWKVAVAAAALALGACRRGPGPEGVRAAIRDADVAFAAATAARGVDGWVSFFADSGVMMTPGRNVVGPPAIRELMAPELGDTTRTLTWSPTVVEASSDGGLGYTIGRWERTAKRADSTVTRRGSYVTIWKKQGDGTWKVVLDVGNADPAP